MTYIEEYWEQIKTGKIIACTKIKIVYEYLVYCLHHDMGIYEFDELLANKPIEFIQTFCRQANGKKFGQPLQLELFQKAKHQAIFGFVDKDTRFRQYNETMTVEGRKNGKTVENAADALFMTVGDGEGSAENFVVATKKEQARKCYEAAWKMVSIDDDLRKYVVNGKAEISYPSNFSTFKALGSEDLDSFDSHYVVIDELAAIKKRSVYDDMKQSTSARDQPLVSSISTNNFVRDNIFDSQYEYASGVIDFMEDFLNKSKELGHDKAMEMVREQDDTGNVLFVGIIDFNFIPFIYELDDRKEWDKEEMWIKANPGLGPIKKFKTLQGYVKKAKNDESFKATVMVKDFNMKENPVTRWLRWEELHNPEMIGHSHKFTDIEYNYDMLAESFEKQRFRYCIGGFDFAETTDLAAAKIGAMREKGGKLYTLSMYWVPEQVLDKLEDKRKNAYKSWIAKGLLRVCPGYKIRKQDVFDWFIEVQNDLDIYIFSGGYDKWHIQEAEERFLESNFGKGVWKPIIQGAKTLSTPMYELKEDLKANQVPYNAHPIDIWCLSNLEIKTDINANIQPVKPGYGDKNAKIDNGKKIDGAIALIILYARLKQIEDEYMNLI